MKVKELIEKLKALPPDADVEIAYTEHDNSLMSSSYVEKEISNIRADAYGTILLCESSRVKE